jgi:6-pyruvoyltetrahydropterin/6-carboxytetrahydropterin synthase
MHNVRAVRRIQFCAGHRVFRHESKCRNLHGHNYVAFLHAVAPSGLDPIGRVIDFGVLKQKVGGWIEDNWDHGFIVWREDEEAIRAAKQVTDQRLFVLPANPTAENLAIELIERIAPAVLQGTGISIAKVVLWETENSFAEVDAHVR